MCLILAFWAGGPASAANCSAFQIILSSQGEVDQFQAQHGPCTELTGQLMVMGPNVTNLNGLSALTKTGSLIVLSNPSLTSLTGLSALTDAGESLWVSRNAALPSLAGLQNLRTAGAVLIFENDVLANVDHLSSLATVGVGGLFVTANPMLRSVSGLRSLVSVEGDVAIDNLPQLESLAGLGALRTVGGYFTVGNDDSLESLGALVNLTSVGKSLQIGSNAALATLGFGSLTTIGLGVDVGNNPVLATLAGLGSITTLRSLSIMDCPALHDLDEIDSLEEVSDSLVIRRNASLVNIDSLASIEKIGGIQILENPLLADVDGLAGLTAIEGDAAIAGDSLADVDGLSDVVSVTGELAVGGPILDNLRGLGAVEAVGSLFIGLPLLTTLDDLESLRTVQLNLTIAGNPRLESLAALHRIEEVFGLTIEGNSSLVDLHGLEGIERVGFLGVRISNNGSLRNLRGLDSLEEITGNLYIGKPVNDVDNRALSSLDGLEALTRVEQSIRIEHSPLLADVDGLSGLSYAGSLTVAFNPRLGDCRGLMRVLDAVDDPPEGAAGESSQTPDVGNVELFANGAGCNSIAEVLATPPQHPCERDERTACLLDERFRVRADMWDFSNGPLGPGALSRGRVQTYDGVRAETNLSVSFYSFQEGNVELFVKMLDACPVPFHTFWVFASGATNAQAEVEVLDTWTGEKFRVYNPRGGLFSAAAATDAFATCEAPAP